MQFSRKPKPKMLCLLKESVLYQICKCINEYLIHNMVNFPKKLVLTYVGWAFPAVTKGVGVKYPIDFFLLFFSLLSFFQKKLCIKKLCILLTFFFSYSNCSTVCLLPCLAVVLSTGRTVCSSRLGPIWGLLESCCVCWQSGTSFPFLQN